MNLTMIFFRPMMTQMAIFLERKEFESFVHYRRKLLQSLVVISSLILAVVSVIGVPILNIVYSTNLNRYLFAFIILILWRNCKYFCDSL